MKTENKLLNSQLRCKCRDQIDFSMLYVCYQFSFWGWIILLSVFLVNVYENIWPDQQKGLLPIDSIAMNKAQLT